MHHYYENYYWKDGKPYGVNKKPFSELKLYKIVVDPYYKRFSLERYENNKFHSLVYDSHIFDFRDLRKKENAVWQKESLGPLESLIRNHDDRVILKEFYTFKNERFLSCRLESLQGHIVSVHKVFRKDFGDDFNGVILFDREEKPIMKKTYTINSHTLEFEEIIEETWDFITHKFSFHGFVNSPQSHREH